MNYRDSPEEGARIKESLDDGGYIPHFSEWGMTIVPIPSLVKEKRKTNQIKRAKLTIKKLIHDCRVKILAKSETVQKANL